MTKISPNKDMIFSLLSFIHKEVVSSCGDGDALWYTRFFDIKDIFELVKEFNEVNSIGWEVYQNEPYEISWGKEQEWVMIVDDKKYFDGLPDTIQLKIQY